ncbi:MAG: hypothetical protein GY832_11465 [Chloroflexi bacterium]|nr:hypothetical protein [Chloroflexota bacterium]
MRASLAAILLVVAGCNSGAQFTGGAMVGDNTAEVRLGAQLDALELYAAPRMAMDLEDSGDIGTGIRGYAIYNAITVDMIGDWFGSEVDLPEGAAYGGIYGGRDWGLSEWQAGWLVGARADIGSTEKYQLDFVTEYQHPIDGDGSEVVMAGPRLLLK